MKLTVVEILILAAIAMLLALIAVKACFKEASQEPTKKVLEKSPTWESIPNPYAHRLPLYRTKTPDGWLVYGHDCLTHVQDPTHEWLR